MPKLNAKWCFFACIIFFSLLVITCQQPSDNTPAAGTGAGSGDTTGRGFHFRTLAKVFVRVTDSVGSERTEAKIAQITKFYQERVAEFNRNNKNPVVLGSRREPPVIFEDGTTFIPVSFYVKYSSACDPCTIPPTRPPYPDEEGDSFFYPEE